MLWEASAFNLISKITNKIERLEKEVNKLKNDLNKQELDYYKEKENNEILRGEMHILMQKKG